MTVALRAVTDVRAIKVRPGRNVELPDRVVTEEPLEIRVAGPGERSRPVAVTMRTPGHDFELAVGFLVGEGLVTPPAVAAVGYCDAADPDNRLNTVTVSLRSSWQPPAERTFVAASSCGVCGKTGIDQVEVACPVLPQGPRVPASVIGALPEALRRAQRVFDSTGGLHAAGVFDHRGELLLSREDIGRHNAVDKVVGRRALDQAGGNNPNPAGDRAVLLVSGRVSFEIVQKVAMAGMTVLAAVSAPSSLAIAVADRLGVTIAGFVRDGTYNLYSHPERVDLDS
jgi:FdhD protein